VLIAFFRELLGAGSITIWGDLAVQLIPEAYQISILVAPAGAFLVFGVLVAQVNKLKFKKEDQQGEVA
jgi:Na+-translocating ferredoxin:NAD+ oxidoreductase RnfE subunit